MESDEFERTLAFFEERLAEQEDRHRGWTDAWRAFCPTVLAHGGTLVVPPPAPDPLLELYRQRAAVFDGVGAELVAGDRDCHTAAVVLWRTGIAAEIGTGYALSDDELWREHSWCWNHDGVLLEPTAPRLRYFGLRLADERAQWFADWIDPR